MRSLCFASVVLLWALPLSSSTFAQACPALMRTASRLIIVTVPTLKASAGKLRLFERRRSDAGWSVVGAAEPVTLGSKGVAWGRSFRYLAAYELYRAIADAVQEFLEGVTPHLQAQIFTCPPK